MARRGLARRTRRASGWLAVSESVRTPVLLLVPRFYRIEANIEEVPRIRRRTRRGISTPAPQPGRRNTHRFDGFVALVSLVGALFSTGCKPTPSAFAGAEGDGA